MTACAPLPLALIAALAAFSTVTPAHATTISFAGYSWDVRSGAGNPGSNQWNPNNVFVDANGALHLKITNVNGVWQCAEVTMTQRLGFGTYEFDVTGPIDRLDPNIVLGLFDYPTPDVGPDGTNEIDIEYSRWGNPNNQPGNYTVWPAVAGFEPATHSFSFAQTSNQSTQRFSWTRYSVSFSSLNGYLGGTLPSFTQWTYRPVDWTNRIPQKPLPVHLNLWLFQGHAPTNAQPVEIVITGFRYTPSQASAPPQ
jgi:hypothetical protein